MDFLDALNDNSGAIQALATAVLVLVTGGYAFFAYRLVQEMRRQSRPYVVLDFEMTQSSLDVAIVNLGNRAATDVTFDVVNDLSFVRRRGERETEERLSDLPVMRKGLEYLPPNRRLLFDFSWPQELLGSSRPDTELQLEVKVSYSYDKQRFEEAFLFDLSLYRDGMLYRSFTGEREALEPHLRGIERALRDLKPPLTSWPLGVAMKLCEVCGEPVRSEARKCPHCLEWLGTNGAEPGRTAQPSSHESAYEPQVECDDERE